MGQNAASRIVLTDYASLKSLWFVRRKVKTERQSGSIDLLIGMFSGVVHVLVIGIQLQMLGQWQQATGIQSRGRPLGIRAFVQEFHARVGGRMVGTNGNTPLNRNSIAISPFETAVGPIEIGAIPVCN
jgi:hypothetical protein